jgi:hypothetical protein
MRAQLGRMGICTDREKEMKKTIKIEVPEGETPKLVNVGDDGWRVEFEEAKEIALKGLDLLKTLIPGDYVEINGNGMLVIKYLQGLKFLPIMHENLYAYLNDINELRRINDFEHVIGMKIADITEDHIQWRWKAPR